MLSPQGDAIGAYVKQEPHAIGMLITTNRAPIGIVEVRIYILFSPV